ncbi:IclR family transcriptional regulator domain-containing protein [Paraburkholderia caribensis]|uniref:IclR family transcriptional regulator domain-containing protein n=1 Tax=Paraburkholderia caribensis TaxID=75105 RepID=UPI001CB419DF|nr:IclR family transcriptional regulator C-terminal domain-containing protein [Paraburkholderia caribensis]CAG9243773.1 Transcriptional regulator, IclR family [Paraburkholderia caribensis]
MTTTIMVSDEDDVTENGQREPAGAATERTEYVQSLERGISVIKAFGEDTPRLTLAEVAKSTGLARGAARRFLLTLQKLGYIDTDGRYFFLKPSTLEIGYSYLSSLPWWKSAQRVTDELSRDLGISVAVGVLERDTVVYVAYGLPDKFAISGRTVGTRLPAYASAIGRVLLAYANASEQNEYFSSAHLQKLTPATQTDVAKFKAALEDVAQNGFALVDQELQLGLKTLAVPIRNRAGVVVAAMGIDLSSLPGSVETLMQSALPKLTRASARVTEGFAN